MKQTLTKPTKYWSGALTWSILKAQIEALQNFETLIIINTSGTITQTAGSVITVVNHGITVKAYNTVNINGYTTAQNILKIEGNHNTISGFQFTANFTDDTVSAICISGLYNKIENCYLSSTANNGSAIRTLTGAANNIIESVYVYTGFLYGVHINSNYNWVCNSYLNVYEVPIYVYNGSYNTISSCSGLSSSGTYPCYIFGDYNVVQLTYVNAGSSGSILIDSGANYNKIFACHVVGTITDSGTSSTLSENV